MKKMYMLMLMLGSFMFAQTTVTILAYGNVRAEALVSAPSVAKPFSNLTVKVEGVTGDYYLVTVDTLKDKAVTGYIWVKAIEISADGKNAVVVGQGATLRTKPDKASEAAGYVTAKTVAIIKDCVVTWYKVTIDGRTGWVSKAALVK
jgi:hypothetical protein